MAGEEVPSELIPSNLGSEVPLENLPLNLAHQALLGKTEDNSFAALPGKIGQNFINAGTDTLKMLASMIAPGALATLGGATAVIPGVGPFIAPIAASAGGYAGGKINQALGLTQGGGMEDILNALLPAIPGIGKGVNAIRGVQNEAEAVLAPAAARVARFIPSTLQKESPMAIAARATPPGVNPYAEFNAASGLAPEIGLGLPEIPMTGLRTTVEKMVAEIPSKPAVKQTFGGAQGIGGYGAEAQAQLKAGAAEIPNPQTPAHEALLALQEKLASTKGQLNLADVQGEMQKFGDLINNPDPKVSGIARTIWYNFNEGLRASNAPEAKLLIQANAKTAQNIAAQELSDFTTHYGTSVAPNGNLIVKPQKVTEWLNQTIPGGPLGETKHIKADLFPSAERQDIEDTLRATFRATSDLAAVTPPKQQFRDYIMKKVAGGLAGGTILQFFGVPYHYAYPVGELAALAYPRAIHQAVMTPIGRQFIRQLYRASPPNVNDTAQAVALAQFLRSTGQTIFGLQGDPNASIP